MASSTRPHKVIDSLIDWPGLPDRQLLDIVSDLPPADIRPAGLLHPAEAKDIFAVKHRKMYQHSADARCDFESYPGIRRVERLWAHYVWKSSVKGRPLREIKADDSEVEHFAEHAAALISELVCGDFSSGSWALVTTPRRRHFDRNFADLICFELSQRLSIPYVRDCTMAKSNKRMCKDFIPNNMPQQDNVIIFDDIVTTGFTLRGVKDILEDRGKKTLIVVGINNY